MEMKEKGKERKQGKERKKRKGRYKEEGSKECRRKRRREGDWLEC